MIVEPGDQSVFAPYPVFARREYAKHGRTVERNTRQRKVPDRRRRAGYARHLARTGETIAQPQVQRLVTRARTAPDEIAGTRQLAVPAAAAFDGHRPAGHVNPSSCGRLNGFCTLPAVTSNTMRRPSSTAAEVNRSRDEPAPILVRSKNRCKAQAPSATRLPDGCAVSRTCGTPLTPGQVADKG